MHLPPDQVERFYRVWFPLLYYVNQQRQLVATFPSSWGKASVEPSAARVLRDALWDDDSLRAGFIAHNPAQLDTADLALVASWKYRIVGKFFVLRYLKKHTVFLLTEEPVRAYAVLGLVSPIADIVGPYLPVYVDAVLLPFEGKIIYDSLLIPYNVSFGGGIRRDLNASYRDVQEHDGLITTLTPDRKASVDDMRKGIQARNKKVLATFQKELGQAGLSPKMMEQHRDTIAAFAEHYLLAAQPPRAILDLTSEDVMSYLDSTQTATPVSFKRFIQFLRNTSRIEYSQAEAMLAALKQSRAR